MAEASEGKDDIKEQGGILVYNGAYPWCCYVTGDSSSDEELEDVKIKEDDLVRE